jgi:hypothetical protein
MDNIPTFPDWPAKRDAIRAALATREPKLDHAGPLRLRNGAVVEPGGVVTAVVARSVFLEIASDVEPRLLVELAGAPLDQYAATWEASGGSPTADPGVALDEEAVLRCQSAMCDEEGALWRWCERWGFPVWLDPPGWEVGTDDRALLRYAADRAWGLVEATYALFMWRVDPLRTHHALRFGDVFLTTSLIDDLDLGLDTPLSLPSQRWDPQREDRAAATKRILAELGRSVRSELGRIEAEALRSTAPPPAKRTGLEHLAWLARYHFRGESFSAIARDVCLERQSVTGAVKAAAALVCLPLREPSRPGPPRGRP